MNRKQFTFYRSFFEGISRIKNKQARCDAYDAIVRYALDGEEPDIDKLPDSAASVFSMAKPNLDASRKKAEGGSKIPQRHEQDTDKIPTRYRQQEKEQEKEQEQMLKEKTKEKTSRFKAPTEEEVAQYCRERRNGVDPHRFVAHYEAVGWKVGKNPMKDWKAAVRTWEGREKDTVIKRNNVPCGGTADPGAVRSAYLRLMEEEVTA